MQKVYAESRNYFNETLARLTFGHLIVVFSHTSHARKKSFGSDNWGHRVDEWCRCRQQETWVFLQFSWSPKTWMFRLILVSKLPPKLTSSQFITLRCRLSPYSLSLPHMRAWIGSSRDLKVQSRQNDGCSELLKTTCSSGCQRSRNVTNEKVFEDLKILTFQIFNLLKNQWLWIKRVHLN